MSPLAGLEVLPPNKEPGRERLSGWAQGVQGVGLGPLSSPEDEGINKQSSVWAQRRRPRFPLAQGSISFPLRLQTALGRHSGPWEVGAFQGWECPLLMTVSFGGRMGALWNRLCGSEV